MSQTVDEVILSEVAEKSYPVQRRVVLPVVLFLLTMGSTFVAGATMWVPQAYMLDWFSESSANTAINLRLALLQHWDTGLAYMACLLLMLLAHEMGHFVATLYYRVPASYPYFLPFPISPLGTLGAVIRMDSRDTDRKQMFDIGIAGPLAGLVVAVPLLFIGTQRLDLTQAAPIPPIEQGHLFDLGLPLGSRFLLDQIQPPGYEKQTQISVLQINPYFMAGWVGLLVTAINMMPVSQLDGGHILYALFGRGAHWIARGFMVTAVAYMVYSNAYWMTIMLGLILLIGVDHPPTSNDRAPLGPVRWVLGLVSLAIPILSLTLEPLIPR